MTQDIYAIRCPLKIYHVPVLRLSTSAEIRDGHTIIRSPAPVSCRRLSSEQNNFKMSFLSFSRIIKNISLCHVSHCIRAQCSQSFWTKFVLCLERTVDKCKLASSQTKTTGRDTKLNRLFVVHCLEIVIIMIIR